MSRLLIYQLFVRHFSNFNGNQVKDGSLEQNGCGKFKDITSKALSEIADLGVNTVWFTGVLEHATTTFFEGVEPDPESLVKGKAGSPYAIKDYFDVAPSLANNVHQRMEEFEALVERTHKAGLKCMIDFVPNHLARLYHSDARSEIEFGAHDDSSKFFSKGNDFYYVEEEGDLVLPNGDIHKSLKGRPRVTGNNRAVKSPSRSDWYEVAKLNYGYDFRDPGSSHQLSEAFPVPPVWNKMRAVLLYWAGKGIDGVRCDMAHMIPTAFWGWVTAEIKKDFPDFIFIAECYEDDPMGCLQSGSAEELVKAGFHAYYDHALYHGVKNVVEGHASAAQLNDVFFSESRQRNGVRYIENHDEVRTANPNHFGGHGPNVAAAAAAWLTGYGPVMIYNGQEVGETAEGASGFSGDDGRTSIFDYVALPELQKWTNNGAFDGALLSDSQRTLRGDYQRLLKFAGQQVFQKGETYGLNYLNQHLTDEGTFVFCRFLKGEVVALVVASFNASPSSELRVRFSADAMAHMGMVIDSAEERHCEETGVKLVAHEDGSADLHVTMRGSVEVVQLAL